MQNLMTPLSQELVRSSAHTDHKGHDVALLLKGVGSAFYVVPLPFNLPTLYHVYNPPIDLDFQTNSITDDANTSACTDI